MYTSCTIEFYLTIIVTKHRPFPYLAFFNYSLSVSWRTCVSFNEFFGLPFAAVVVFTTFFKSFALLNGLHWWLVHTEIRFGHARGWLAQLGLEDIFFSDYAFYLYHYFTYSSVCVSVRNGCDVTRKWVRIEDWCHYIGTMYCSTSTAGTCNLMALSAFYHKVLLSDYCVCSPVSENLAEL
jgi:hypothetical protein